MTKPTPIDKHGDCPECGESWNAGRIWETWRKMDRYKDTPDEELKEMEQKFYAKPYHFSKLLGIEDLKEYDGVSYWQCPYCEATWNRFTNEKVDKFKGTMEGSDEIKGGLSGTKGDDVGDASSKN